MTGTPLFSTKGIGKEFTIKLKSKQLVNQIIVQEEISKGERIRKYKIEGLTSQGWKTLCEGESVGHKRIQTFEPTNVSKVRLVINESVATPQIRNFRVFNVELQN